MISPEYLEINPEIMRRRVVFPQPDGPTMAMISPDWAFREMSSRTSELEPKRLLIPLREMEGPLVIFRRVFPLPVLLYQVDQGVDRLVGGNMNPYAIFPDV